MNISDTNSNKITTEQENRSKPLYTAIFFFVLLVISVGIIVYIVLLRNEISIPKPQAEKAQKFLIDTAPEKSPNDPEKDMSFMIVLLIGCFGTLQTLPVFIAALKAQKNKLTDKNMKEITFLCETPMYLGLLGSLSGVCLTQFMTGSLSAPLAYITTISGILIHLFAKFTIIVPLPGRTISDTSVEV